MFDRFRRICKCMDFITKSSLPCLWAQGTGVPENGVRIRQCHHSKPDSIGSSMLSRVQEQEGHPFGVLECRFRTLSIGLKPVFLHLEIERLECRPCGQTLREKIKYANKIRSRY